MPIPRITIDMIRDVLKDRNEYIRKFEIWRQFVLLDYDEYKHLANHKLMEGITAKEAYRNTQVVHCGISRDSGEIIEHENICRVCEELILDDEIYRQFMLYYYCLPENIAEWE